LESDQAKLQASMASADYYRQGSAQMRLDHARLEQIELELISLLERWETLQAIDPR
jgi:ATP-binding cassette subfamily F protein uup